MLLALAASQKLDFAYFFFDELRKFVVCLTVYMFAWLCFCLFVYLFVCQCFWLSLLTRHWMFLIFSMNFVSLLSVCLFACLSVCMCDCVCLFVYLFVHLFVCQRFLLSLLLRHLFYELRKFCVCLYKILFVWLSMYSSIRTFGSYCFPDIRFCLSLLDPISYMGRVSDSVSVCVCVSVCLSFQRYLSANRSPLLINLWN